MADATSDKAATPAKDEQPPAPPAAPAPPQKADPVPADAEPAGEALGTGAREDEPEVEGE